MCWGTHKNVIIHRNHEFGSKCHSQWMPFTMRNPLLFLWNDIPIEMWRMPDSFHVSRFSFHRFSFVHSRIVLNAHLFTYTSRFVTLQFHLFLFCHSKWKYRCVPSAAFSTRFMIYGAFFRSLSLSPLLSFRTGNRTFGVDTMGLGTTMAWTFSFVLGVCFARFNFDSDQTQLVHTIRN